MGSTRPVVVDDLTRPATINLRKDRFPGWWPQWFGGFALQTEIVTGGGGTPGVTRLPNGTLRFNLDVANDAVIYARSPVILEGYNGGQVQVTARVVPGSSGPIPAAESISVVFVELDSEVGDADFPNPFFPANQIGTTVVFDENNDEQVQEVSAVFTPSVRDGDAVYVGVAAFKSAGNSEVDIDVQGFQISQISNPSIPNGGP